jgi:hypothetical protein
MTKTIAIAAGVLTAAALSMAAAPASAGVSLSIGLHLPLPGVRIGGVITNRPFRPAPRVVLAAAPVIAYPAPIVYAPPVVYGPVGYGPRRVVYAPPLRRHAVAAPAAPRWRNPASQPVAYMAPGDMRRR